jgi:hypothetical protein
MVKSRRIRWTFGVHQPWIFVPHVWENRYFVSCM